jgi:hypothetical protein
MGRFLLVVTIAVTVASGVFASGASATASIDRGKFNYNTHRYINQVRGCLTVTGLVVQIAANAQDEIQVADAATKGRDTCDAIRSRLLRINTDNFDNQASQAWYGVDRMKSGLNALLAYLDTKAPSKLIETRDKLQQGTATAKAGIRAINARRRAYGLRAI